MAQTEITVQVFEKLGDIEAKLVNLGFVNQKNLMEEMIILSIWIKVKSTMPVIQIC